MGLLSFFVIAAALAQSILETPTPTPTPAPPQTLGWCIVDYPDNVEGCFSKFVGAPPTQNQLQAVGACQKLFVRARALRADCIDALSLTTPSPTPTPTMPPTAAPTKPPTATPTEAPTRAPVLTVTSTPLPTSTPAPTQSPRKISRPVRGHEWPRLHSTLTPTPLPTEPPAHQIWILRPPTPYYLGAGGAAFIIISLFYPRIRRRRLAAGVRIDAPGDLTIQVCNRPVTFVAHTTPPGRESELRWEVPLDQCQTNASGSGPTFTTSWTETGVKQVVAKFGNTADDVILFLYKTPSGKATLSDILQTTAPTMSRKPSDYKWHRAHQLPTDGQGLHK